MLTPHKRNAKVMCLFDMTVKFMYFDWLQFVFMKCAQTASVHSELTFVNGESDMHVFYCQCECYIEFTKNPLISNDSFAIYYVNIA